MEGTDYSQTQASTQTKEDPRRYGRNNSGLKEEDLEDVFCILHPASMAAYTIVGITAQRTPQHILQYDGRTIDGISQVSLQEQDTFRLDAGTTSRFGLDLALRFSSKTVEPWNGFVFGRNAAHCDIVITVDTVKRVSNKHFSIYLNEDGVVMLEDMSTNGTMVDEVHLKKGREAHRMLVNGSIIHIVSTKKEEYIKFIVRLPSREGCVQKYSDRFHKYMRDCAAALARKNNLIPAALNKKTMPVAPGIPKSGARPLVGASNPFGMHWNGGNTYNVIGHLGKGAFATVYRIATAKDGKVLAAKELEKKTFFKNGQLDTRLDNEMTIMKALSHKNIVQYIDYHDVDKHLYIIMEFIPYGDLAAYMHKNGVLGEPKAKEMSRQILDALDYLHKRQITHRDIKPDNILIANLADPFEVKLTDFGLSKVVKDPDQFMRTFCGTLLYCAPEVFPHYDNKLSKGTKRRRGDKANSHMYGSSVDIWSFGAVLWFVLCGQTPWKGLTDATGRAMFEQIISKKPDAAQLQNENVSDQAMQLLFAMLDTDPAKRPSPLECLHFDWLDDGTTSMVARGLGAIQEEDEDASVGAEDQFSQMSIRGQQSELDREDEPNPMDSPNFRRFVGVRASKRTKTDPLFPRNQTRDRGSDSDSENPMQDDIPLEESGVLPRAQMKREPKLFGEIGASALQSSGVLGAKTHEALDLRDSSTSVEASDAQSSILRYSHLFGSVNGSLDGTDSRFRDLGIANEQVPTQNLTPEVANGHTPTLPVATPSNGSNGQDEVTPKAPKAPVQPFSRRIELPPAPSSFYDPRDPSTHNLEYASRKSGIDFTKLMPTQAATSALAQATGQVNATNAESVHYPILPTESNSSSAAGYVPTSDDVLAQLPDTMQVTSSNPTTPNDLPSSPHAVSNASSTTSSQFVKPGPRLGRLTTIDSIASITISLDKSSTSFGRSDVCTVQYHPVTDTRVPKKAFEIWFFHPDLRQYEEEGRDWTQLEGLRSGIITFSSAGIYVNNVRLTTHNKHGQHQFGFIHTGDVVTIFKDSSTKAKLQFKIELFKGEGTKPRANPHEFVVLREASKTEEKREV